MALYGFVAMKRAERQAHLAVLSSPIFALSLAALVCNDWLLKSWLHDWLTGKLSDFCGLFVFASLMLIVFSRHARYALVGVAILFTWWKSSFSQPAIDFFNSLPLIHLHRTVDYSDLMALLVLPLASTNFQRHKGKRSNRLLVYPLGALALSAVMATSALPVIEGGEVHLAGSNVDDSQYISMLYETIDTFANAHNLVLDTRLTDHFHRSYSSSAYSLQVNYDAASKTLYYGFGPTKNYFPLGGVSVDPSVRQMEAEFLQTVSSRFPDLKSENDKQYSAWGGGQLGQRRDDVSQFGIHFPEAHMDPQGCVQPDDSNPDVKRALEIADEFAKEQGLQATELSGGQAGCAGLVTRSYVGGGIVGPGLVSYGLQFTVEPGFDELDALFFRIDRRAHGASDSASLAAQLYNRFQTEHWKSDKVRIDSVQQF